MLTAPLLPLYCNPYTGQFLSDMFQFIRPLKTGLKVLQAKVKIKCFSEIFEKQKTKKVSLKAIYIKFGEDPDVTFLQHCCQILN